MVLIAWKNKLFFLVSFSYSCIFCPAPGKIVRQATKKKQNPNSRNQIVKDPNFPLPMLIFVWWHFMWGASAVLHTQRQKQTLPFKLKFSDTTEISGLGIWAREADEPPWSCKWCPWKGGERLWPHPSWWGSASPVSWNRALKAPRCSHFAGAKMMSKFECVWWYYKTHKATR